MDVPPAKPAMLCQQSGAGNDPEAPAINPYQRAADDDSYRREDENKGAIGLGAGIHHERGGCMQSSSRGGGLRVARHGIENELRGACMVLVEVKHSVEWSRDRISGLIA
jgi:hypothetical protein